MIIDRSPRTPGLPETLKKEDMTRQTDGQFSNSLDLGPVFMVVVVEYHSTYQREHCTCK